MTNNCVRSDNEFRWIGVIKGKARRKIHTGHGCGRNIPGASVVFMFYFAPHLMRFEKVANGLIKEKRFCVFFLL